MLKFRSKLDEIQFNLLKINEEVIRKKYSLIKKKDKHKDPKKSSDTKSQWRKNRYKMLKGIRKFHRSTDGKRFHRKMANHLAMSEGKEYDIKENRVYLSFSDVYNFLFNLTTIETHLYLELEYYEPDFEDFSSFLELIYNFLEVSFYLKGKILETYDSGYMDLDDFNFYTEVILDFLDPMEFMKEYRKHKNIDNQINQMNESELKKYNELVNFIKENYNVFENINETKKFYSELIKRINNG